jgi:hypothetical protein
MNAPGFGTANSSQRLPLELYKKNRTMRETAHNAEAAVSREKGAPAVASASNTIHYDIYS